MKFLLKSLICSLGLLSLNLNSQQFDPIITINSQNINQTETAVFDELKNSISDFLINNSSSFYQSSKHLSFLENILEIPPKFITVRESMDIVGVLPILKKNLNNLNMREKYEIIEEDLISNYFLKKIQLKFNIIFLDPPYKEKRLSNIIDNIFQEKILNKDGVIIVHRHKKENDEFSKNFRILDEKKYGISKIIIGD